MILSVAKNEHQMSQYKLFEKRKKSEKVLAGGPSFSDQILAMAQGNYWTVLNTHFLIGVECNLKLSDRVNAFKHALQTFGPFGDGLPNIRQNKNAAQGSVFHGHITNSGGITYVLEWALVDVSNKIMAIVNFDTHENYTFRQAPLNNDEKDCILANERNIKIINHALVSVDRAKSKVERTQLNYCSAVI